MHYIFSRYVDIVLLLVMILPLISGLLASFVLSSKKIRRLTCLFFSFLTGLILFCIFDYFLTNGALSIELFSINNIPIKFSTEPIGLIFGFMVIILWICNSIYTIGYAKTCKYERIKESTLFTYMSFAIFATLALAFSANLLTMFISYEFITIFTYPLIIENKNSKAKKIGCNYLLTMFGTSYIFILPAILYIYNSCGTLNFSNNGITNNHLNNIESMILLTLFILGSSKAAIFPFFSWLKKAMIAHAPVSALFHAVAVVKAGVIFIIKIVVYIFGIDNLGIISRAQPLFYIFILSILFIGIIYSSSKALFEDKIKVVLAYSTITNLNYIVLSTLLFTQKAIISAILYMIAHALSKISLFFGAGMLLNMFNISKISEINNNLKINKITLYGLLLAILSMLGFPPLSMFFSKYLFIKSAWNSEYYMQIIILSIVYISMGYYYYGKIILRFFFKNANCEAISCEGVFAKSIRVQRSLSFKRNMYINIPILVVTLLNVLYIFYIDDILELVAKAALL